MFGAEAWLSALTSWLDPVILRALAGVTRRRGGLACRFWTAMILGCRVHFRTSIGSVCVLVPVCGEGDRVCMRAYGCVRAGVKKTRAVSFRSLGGYVTSAVDDGRES